MLHAHTGNDHHEEAKRRNDERGSKVWFNNDKGNHERWNGCCLNEVGKRVPCLCACEEMQPER